ncbi:MAG TPA: AI-2E family transporter [Acidobacteriota bacterium]|nr:AI-2E family transporter [Acidobacteriota bacterium]
MKKTGENHVESASASGFPVERFSRLFLLIFVVVFTVLFLHMIRFFLMPILVAAVICSLTFPFYKRILESFGKRRSLSSFVTCFLLLIFLLIPLFIIGDIVSREAVEFYSRSDKKIQEIIDKGDLGPLGQLKNSKWFRRLNLERLDWRATFTNIAGSIGTVLTVVIRKTSGGAFQIIAGTFVTLFIMFYFFRDGELIVSRLKHLIPLEDDYEDVLIERFVNVSRATFKGTFVIGLIQSTIGAITLWIFGIETPVLWWVVMLIFSMIPLFGAWIVMHTAAIVQLLSGNKGEALGIFLVTVCIISVIDNFLRPRLVGQFTGMHDLIIFLSALGGIATFGPLGIIAGPIVAAFFVTLLEIYSKEFRAQLLYQRNASDPKSKPTD